MCLIKKQLYLRANFSGATAAFQSASPIRSFPPNGFGLDDVLGNVWELVEDCSGRSYVGAPFNGAARNTKFRKN